MFLGKQKIKPGGPIQALSQKGQTLIETLAAVFILSMGLSAAVGLAIYAFNTSGGITKQIMGVGLAREGLEAVRNMRDTNWLQDTLVSNGCYNYVTNIPAAAPCYQNWLGKNGNSVPFCINPSPGASCNGNDVSDSYFLGFDPASANFWVLKKDASNFGLNFDAANSGGLGFYFPGAGNGGVACQSAGSDYCRDIVITSYSTANGNAVSPYDKDLNLLLLKVQSQVWWIDRKCPRAASFAAASPTCKVELDTYLTNWKNF